jgi:hypothetical protein
MICLIYSQLYIFSDTHVATNCCLDCTKVEEELS